NLSNSSRRSMPSSSSPVYGGGGPRVSAVEGARCPPRPVGGPGMSAVADHPTPARSRFGLLYHPRVRSLALQVVGLALVAFAAWWVIRNTVDNLHQRNIASGFAFFNARAGFDIGQSLIPFNSNDTIGQAFIVGVLNTVLVAVLGIILATIIGLAVGL